MAGPFLWSPPSRSPFSQYWDDSFRAGLLDFQSGFLGYLASVKNVERYRTRPFLWFMFSRRFVSNDPKRSFENSSISGDY